MSFVPRRRSILCFLLIYFGFFHWALGSPYRIHEMWTLVGSVGVGWVGSPTYCDLNGDGESEAIVPVVEPTSLESSTIQVLDVRSGQRLFRTTGGEAGFGYPLCFDTNGDGTLDIITGGHINDVYALSGIDGSRLWALSDTSADAISGHTFTPVAIPQYKEFFFITTGGNSDGAVDGKRNPGSLLVLGRRGQLIAKWDEPQKKEMYSSPAAVAVGNDDNDDRGDSLIYIAVGSGGETISGSLYLLLYNETTQMFSQIASFPSACENGGFISSPIMGDVNGDGVPDVVASDICGAIHAYSIYGDQLWQQQQVFDFGVSNPILADLDEDDIYDIVVATIEPNFSFPETFLSQNTIVSAYRGIDGTVFWTKFIQGHIVVSSPATADLDGDGLEDIWLVAARRGLETSPPYLLVLSGADGTELLRYESVNWAGTPLVGDANGNELLDVLVIDVPQISLFPVPIQKPAEIRFLEIADVEFREDSYSGFRGPNHDGYRPSDND